MTEHRLELRKRHLGASEIPAVCGLNPYQTPGDVWLEKVGDLDPVPPNEDMDIGNRLEDAVLDWAADQIEAKTVKNQFRVARVNAIFAATFDALVVGRPEAIEAKTAGIRRGFVDPDEWGEPGTDQVPDRVLMQAQAQMLVGDGDRQIDRVWVPALIGGRGLTLYVVARSEELIGTIYEQGIAFWRHVEERTPPPDVPRLETLRRVRRTAGLTTTVPDELVAAWLSAKEQAKVADELAETRQAELLAALDGAEVGIYSGGSVTFYEQTRRSVDTKRFALEQPELAVEYQRTTTYRAFRHKPNKEK